MEKPKKTYYNINEVASMFDVTATTLRYWEKSFPILNPKTLGNGVRQYQEKDIELIRTIHNLVKVRGFKIAAAKKIINSNRKGADSQTRIMTLLTEVRDELKDITTMIDLLT